MSEKKIENRKGERNLPGPLTWPISSWRPSPPPLPSVVSLLGQKDEGVCPTLAGTRARHLPPAGHLLLPRTPSMPRTKPRSCPAPLSLSLALLFSPCSLSLTREPPPPPTGITVATASPTPSRHAPQIRRDPLYLLVEPRKTEHPVEPSPSPNSTPAAVDPRRRFGSYRASPTSPSRSLVPR